MDARQSKTVLDSGFNAAGSGFSVSGNWILDSNLYWNFRFLELYSGFQSPGFRIPDSGFHSKNLLESVFHKQGDDTQALIT